MTVKPTPNHHLPAVTTRRRSQKSISRSYYKCPLRIYCFQMYYLFYNFLLSQSKINVSFLPCWPFAVSERTITTIMSCCLQISFAHTNTSYRDSNISHLHHKKSILSISYKGEKIFNLNLLHDKTYFVCGENLRKVATRICRWSYRLHTIQIEYYLKILICYRKFQIQSKFSIYWKFKKIWYTRNLKNINNFCLSTDI